MRNAEFICELLVQSAMPDESARRPQDGVSRGWVFHLNISKLGLNGYSTVSAHLPRTLSRLKLRSTKIRILLRSGIQDATEVLWKVLDYLGGAQTSLNRYRLR